MKLDTIGYNIQLRAHSHAYSIHTYTFQFYINRIGFCAIEIDTQTSNYTSSVNMLFSLSFQSYLNRSAAISYQFSIVQRAHKCVSIFRFQCFEERSADIFFFLSPNVDVNFDADPMINIIYLMESKRIIPLCHLILQSVSSPANFVCLLFALRK